MVDRRAVNRVRSSQRDPGPRWPLGLPLALSLAGHVLFGVFLGQSLALPDLDITLQIPIDVELGMTEEVAAAPTPESIASAPEPKSPAHPKAPKHEASVDAGPADAGELGDAGIDVDGGPSDAGSAVPLVVADAGPPGARLPPGAQIALRVDMARIRQSPIADDIRSLLASIPDWKALLDGSGIEPVTQLERLLIMTPNLQREKVALAGRYVGGREVVDSAVRNLGEAHGGDVSWRNKRGIAIATWANADSTPRVIALVGPAHFTISREEDLDRVLAIAAARAQRTRAKSAPGTGSAADALLAMEENEGISLEVEGVEQFVRRARRGIPARLRISALQQGDTSLVLQGRLAYVDETTAGEALAFWEHARDSYARNALVNLLGLGATLQGAQLAQEGADLRITVTLTLEQTRLIIGYARQLLAPAN